MTTDQRTRQDLLYLIKNTEDYADMLITAVEKAKDALTRVTNLTFDDEMARYGENGQLTDHASDAIKQYQDMVSQCEDALEILQVVVSSGAVAV